MAAPVRRHAPSSHTGRYVSSVGHSGGRAACPPSGYGCFRPNRIDGSDRAARTPRRFSLSRGTLVAVNRRLRLALLLATLAAASPSAVPLAFLAPREQVSITWAQATPARRLEERSKPTTPVIAPEGAESGASTARVLPDSLRIHSLFQRPPPLAS